MPQTVKGERGYSSRGKTPVKRVFDPIPKGDYDLQLVGQSVETRVAEASGVPYINYSMTALNTAKEGQKDSRVFGKMWLGIDPSPKGNVPLEGADQLLGFARGIGEELSFTGEDVIVVQAKKDDGTIRETRIIDPRAAREWLMNHDQVIAKAHVKVKPGRAVNGTTYEPQNEIAYFIEAEVQETSTEYLADDLAPEVEVEEEEPEVVPPAPTRRTPAKTTKNGATKQARR